MKALLPLGLALAFAALFIGKCGPRFGWFAAPHELVMAEGDRGEVDETTVLYLESFTIETYPSGKPRAYVSQVKIIDQAAHTLDAATITVNHPLRKNGWWIYQYGYGPDQTDTMCTQLRCVKDPALPLAALGGLLALFGALGFVIVRRGPPRPAVSPGGWRRALAWVMALAVVALPVFIIGRAVMRPEPVPALQSWLMAPHVAAYSASYLILLFAAFGIGRRFVPTGFFLMTLGLVLGAVWGKMAWSEWWQFDPKENWSFVTWLAFAVALYLKPGSRAEAWLLRVGGVLIVITLTWVNFSRMVSGLHSYAANGYSPVRTEWMSVAPVKTITSRSTPSATPAARPIDGRRARNSSSRG